MTVDVSMLSTAATLAAAVGASVITVYSVVMAFKTLRRALA